MLVTDILVENMLVTDILVVDMLVTDINCRRVSY